MAESRLPYTYPNKWIVALGTDQASLSHFAANGGWAKLYYTGRRIAQDMLLVNQRLRAGL